MKFRNTVSGAISQNKWSFWSSRARLWTQRELALSRFRGMVLWAGLVGFFGALVVAGFREALGAFEQLLTGHKGELITVASQLAAWRRVLIPTLGGCLAGLVVQYGMRWMRNRRTTTDYMEAFIVGDGHISVRASLIKSTSSLFSIGSGGSMGREGAMVQLSAMVASKLCRLMDFPTTQTRVLVACGAAAGLASAYNAPLAASVFVAEIVVGSIEFELVAPVMVSAVIGNATMHGLLGYAPIFTVPTLGLTSNPELLLYLLLGVAAGRLSPLYLSSLKKSSEMFARLPAPIFARFALGGLGLGLISVISPEVWGNGHGAVDSILHDPWTREALLLVLVLKVLATMVTVGSGAIGGVFTPTLLVGACLGALWGTQCQLVFPAITGPASAYAVVGMAAFLAATTRAPLMAILMLFEMTRDYSMVLPLMLACTAANFVALPYGASMYAEALKREQGVHDHDFSLMGQLLPGPAPVVTTDDSLETIRNRLMVTPYNHVQVVDSQGRWLGTVTRQTAESAGSEAKAADLLREGGRFLESGMSLEQALRVASEIPSELLPVLEEDTNRFLGTVIKSDLLASLEQSWRAKSSRKSPPPTLPGSEPPSS